MHASMISVQINRVAQTSSAGSAFKNFMTWSVWLEAADTVCFFTARHRADHLPGVILVAAACPMIGNKLHSYIIVSTHDEIAYMATRGVLWPALLQ